MDPYVPSDSDIRRLLGAARNIAVVGLSENPTRPSFDVAEYLRSRGYTIIPVNPTIQQWEGLKAYPDLASVRAAGIQIDLVDVFRRPEEVEPVVDDAIRVRAPAIWFQLGVINEAAAEKAKRAGLTVVMDRCTRIEHRRLLA